MKRRAFRFAAVVAVTFCASYAHAAINFPSSSEIDRFLITGMKSSDAGDAVNIQNTEIGADRAFLSDGNSAPNSVAQGGPNTRDVFYQNGDRWTDAGSPPSPAAPVFKGIDWSGNVAVTSATGRFSMSDMDVFADLGVRVGNSNANASLQSVSNTYWFQDQQTTTSGLLAPGNGVESFDSQPLLNQLETWKTFIQSLTAETTITENIENENRKDGSGPYVTDVDAIDANNDGLAVIDISIDNGNSDFLVNNSDWILQGSEDTLAIFRIRGESNFLLSDSSILKGDGGIGKGGLGAIFFKGDEEGSESSDAVFDFENVILNGIALWDLVTVGEGGTTELNINDGQGCAQFVSSAVTFNDVRWNLCSEGLGKKGVVPEPASIVVWSFLFAIGVLCRRRRRA